MATKEQKVKSVLSVYRERDPLYGFRYVADPYVGCSHQCLFCISPKREENKDDIQVKINAAEVLSRQLVKKQREIVGLGQGCDPYMLLEKHYLITHDILQVLAVQGFPVHIVTKSNMVQRDRKLLQEIQEKTMATVTFQFGAPSLELAKNLEPNAPSPIKRFNALHNLATKGINCGIALYPILPFISEWGQGIKQLILAAKESGASYVLAAPLTTNTKSSKKKFLTYLEQYYPALLDSYRDLYGRKGKVPDSYWQPIDEMIKTLTYEQGMAYEPPFWSELQKKQLSLF